MSRSAPLAFGLAFIAIAALLGSLTLVDQPARFTRSVETSAIRNRIGDATPNERRTNLLLTTPGEKTNRDSGRWIVIATPDETPARIGHLDRVAGGNAILDARDLPRVDPKMTCADAALAPLVKKDARVR